MTTINYDKALELLRAAVEEKGEDYVYQDGIAAADCNYSTPDAEPSCIVGNAYNRVNPEILLDLWKFEWDKESIRNGYARESASASSQEVLGIVHDRGVEQTGKATKLFDSVQAYQDMGTPWGEALSLGIEQVGKWKWDDDENRDWS